MTVRALLLYRLPPGVAPVPEDTERLMQLLSEQLGCVPLDGRAALTGAAAAGTAAAGTTAATAGATAAGTTAAGTTAAAAPERQLEALVTILRQAPAPDTSGLAEPRALRDVWLFRLPREAPGRAFLLLRGVAAARCVEADPAARAFLERRLEYRARGQVAVHGYAYAMGGGAGGSAGGSAGAAGGAGGGGLNTSSNSGGQGGGSDVTVKLLQLSQQGGAPRALALELAYHPATELGPAAPLLAELAGAVCRALGEPSPGVPGRQGALRPLAPRYDAELPAAYGPLHLAEAYADLLAAGLPASR